MKTLFKSIMAIMIIAVLFGACKLGEDETTDDEKDSVINFTSTDTNPAIKVRNNTGERLVAFKGGLNTSLIIGGIPAHAQNHGFAKGALFTNKSEDFPMILITEADYNANKSNLKSLEDKPFTRVYVFYNAQGENTNIYDISGRLGGDFKLVIQNPTNFNVELRLGGVNGETIGYAPKGMLTTTLYVNEGDFDIFPVFKRYNSLRDLLETLYPQAATGYSWFLPLGFDSSVPGGKEKTFNVSRAVETLVTKSLGVAWLAINNMSDSGSIHLMKDDAPVRTNTGVSYFSGTRTFQLDMDSSPSLSGGSVTFSPSKTFVLKVGPNGFEVPIKTIENGSTSLLIKTDMLYQVTVTGDFQSQEGLTAVIELREGEESGPTPVSVDWTN